MSHPGGLHLYIENQDPSKEHNKENKGGGRNGTKNKDFKDNKPITKEAN